MLDRYWEIWERASQALALLEPILQTDGDARRVMLAIFAARSSLREVAYYSDQEIVEMGVDASE